MKNLTINAFEYALNEKKTAGKILIADSQRLSSEFIGESMMLNWVLVGDKINQFGYPQLRLTVEGSAEVVCQRCLTPFTFGISSQSVIILAKDEENAAQIDSLLDNSSTDVVVCETTLNVIELIEDEVLLCLPLSPKHYPVCPSYHLNLCEIDMEEDTKRRSFEILKDLRSADY